MKRVKVIVNGYGVIGKRVADAVALQDDMELVGVSDVATDYRIWGVLRNQYPLYASTPEALKEMRTAGFKVAGGLEDILPKADVAVDCTPKGIGAKNKALYDQHKVKSVFQGGEKHELTGFSFVAQANYEGALGRDSVRAVSCNTTGICRTMGTLQKEGLIKRARISIFRRGTDPWESHLNGQINTVTPENAIPSHQGPDAQTVIPDLNLVTIASSGPFNLSHMHTAFVELTKTVSKDDILQLYQHAPRIAFVRSGDGLVALNSVIELMRDLKRPRNDMWEVALWEDILTVEGNELYLIYQAHNESIVIPENIDAIRAVTKLETDPTASIKRTNASLGIKNSFRG
ncbi:MAG: type II glyceraldehyde-3-phosphate dehydrogenase [Patescibacteria group bacterium]|nr:MAG: type II glyceraldehyde-3-phosphate dehydrogenase [Patescibacteria group bacterium]